MKPVNTAILSFGMSGQVFHAPFIHVLPQFNLYGAWERTKNIAAEKYPGIKTFRSLEELLADKNIDLVIVNTPNYTHYEYTIKSLLAGKHVVVEKPFTVTVKEGELLIALAKEKNVVLSVYHNRRYDSDYKTVKMIVDENLLGDIVEAEFHYDRFSGQLSPKVHKETPGPGTGALYDLGSHLVDQALQLFGAPEKVFGDLRIVRNISKVPDYFELLLYYKNLRVRLHSSYLVREALPAYQLHGTRGSFIKAKTDVQEVALQSGRLPGSEDWGTEPDDQRGILHTEKNGKISRELIPSLRGNYSEYYEGVYRAIRDRLPPPVSAGEGLTVIKVIEAGIKSDREGRVIHFQ